MAQHDYDIANQSFPAFRTDLNNVLGAINSSNSGTSRPSSAVAGTIWLDTSGGATANTLKFYDGADDISLANINTTANTVDWLDSSVVADLVNDTSPQLGGNLDTNSHNIAIDDAHGILDENSNEQLIFQTTASAVNYLEVTNSATSNNPSISATGSDTNVGIEFSTKGTGAIKFNDLAYIPQQALTSSSNAVAWDTQAKPNAYHLTTENTTFSAPTNAVEGAFICVEINYNGSHTIAFNTVFEFAGSTAPTFTSADGKTDIMVFKYNGAIWQEVGRTLNLSES
ncbi:hypothetical protein N8637_01120 [Verrucomicrobia bacterium]|nr:hypothetical protein [Verrucomicrobiota bacterium]